MTSAQNHPLLLNGNKKMKTILLTILFPFLFFIVAHSQDVKKSTKIEKIKGKEYYIHTVKKGESVWKIAKAYNVSSDDIISANPDANKEIKPGQKLKIPVKKSETNKGTELINHTVEKGENLYTIAKKYAVSVDEIQSANPDLTEKIKPGQTIKIPVKSGNIQIKNTNFGKDTVAHREDSTKYDCSKSKKLNSYNIALMIPFYLDNIYQINLDDPDIKDKDTDDYTSFTFVQYYEGILMAVDSLKKIGFSARIYVYDVDDDTAATLKILENTELPKMHLIIGPFFENSLNVVARFAKKYNIKVVDPVSADDDILKGNPNVFNAFPSVNMQLKQLAAFIVERYPGSPVAIVHNNIENEKNYLTVFKTALNNELKKAGKIENSFKEVVYNTAGVTGIARYFSNTDTNIVVTLTNGEIFITNYVSGINNIYDKYKMIIFGLSSWRNFDNIETEYMQNIHLHLFSSSFVDYMDNNVKNFILKYRDQYKTEPDKYAFQGFDIAMFFFKALNDYGINFDKCIDKTGNAYLQSNYKFVRTGENDGFENSFLNIFRYEDYKFIDVRKHPKIIETENEKK